MRGGTLLCDINYLFHSELYFRVHTTILLSTEDSIIP